MNALVDDTMASTARQRGGAGRVLDVARIQTVNWGGMLAWPLGILALTFLLNLAVFAVMGDGAPPEERVSGAVLSIYSVVGITHLITITQVFPFALGLSVTRRAFYAATALVVVAQSVLFGLVLLVLERVEEASAGWGIRLQYFALPFLRQDSLLMQWLVFTVPFLAISATGLFVGVVFKRWGQTGLFVLGVAVTVLFGGAAVLVTWQGWWPAVGSFFGDRSPVALLAGYPLLIALVLGGAGWLAIRRATP